MNIESWWFENKQNRDEILQPDWFIPKTHCGVYIEFEKIELPFQIKIVTFCQKEKIFFKAFDITDAESTQEYDIFMKGNVCLVKVFAETIKGLPDNIAVTIKTNGKSYKKDIKCQYSIIKGSTTDFNGRAFPAAVVFQRRAFGGNYPYIGVWSDKAGKYSITVPNGEYCAYHVEDNSYKKSSLENWSWKMCVDRDEIHNFKIGTGEVYGLSVREDTGGGNFLFMYFRPMILPQIRMQEYTVNLNGKNRKVMDIQPDLEEKDLQVFIDNEKAKILSIQKIYETGRYNEGDYIVIAYVVQIKKPHLNRGKHTAIVEYQTTGKFVAQSQGRTNFFVNSIL